MVVNVNKISAKCYEQEIYFKKSVLVHQTHFGPNYIRYGCREFALLGVPVEWGVQLALDEGPIKKVGPTSQPRG